MNHIPDQAKVSLISIIFCPQNEMPWTVQDVRRAWKNEYPCRTKADVLNRLAIILDDIHNPANKLDQDNDPLEITVAVRLQASLCEPATR